MTMLNIIMTDLPPYSPVLFEPTQTTSSGGHPAVPEPSPRKPSKSQSPTKVCTVLVIFYPTCNILVLCKAST